MARQSLQLELAERPKGEIEVGKTFRLRKVDAPTEADLKEGELLLECLYVSLDPAMRGWLDDRRSYVPPVQIGEVMRAGAIARVLASRSAKAKPGDIVTATMGIREVGIMPEAAVEPASRLPLDRTGGKVTDLLGVLGMTGLTAYFGMTKIGEPKAGETVVVSAAAGATGSVAAQIAKIAGARVIGTAGSEEKCRWLKEELGLDVALNYKDPDFKEKFKAATPNYIDVFFDNVGGEQLDMALGRANKFARFVMCGGISQYNAETKSGPTRNFFNVISQRIKMQGFIVFDFATEYGTALKQLAQWLGEGKLQRKETIVRGGVAAAEEGLQQLFRGANIGKLMVEVKNPEEVSRL
ncbi:NAD(P)-binding protein [Parathielavia appendiculata]|uniref:Dehydrogenase FUB6 n=1 Tax=Parathielavia appendiculata TaxID=2587402 RepID=A0AAN6U1X2_9PEZI|nr:NAD(P)-binding protein [Parathielavia appendiculata]